MEGLDLHLHVNSNINVTYNEQAFKSVIQSIDEDKLSIGLPMKAGNFFIPPVGSEIEISYISKLQVYSFKTIIRQYVKENISLIVVDKPKEINRFQRRSFVRVNFLVDAKFYEVNGEEVSGILEKGDTKIIKEIVNRSEDIKSNVKVLDLSGSGAKAIFDKPMKLDDYIILEIPLNDELLIVLSKIVCINKDENNRVTYGINFENLSEHDRDKIIKVSFAIIRQLSKRL